MTNLYTPAKAVRNIRGALECESDIPLKSAKGRVLRVTTMKRHGGKLVTTAWAGIAKPANEYGFASFETCIGGENSDFRMTVIDSGPVRCTAKSVEAQHDAAMNRHAELRKTAEIYYAEQFTKLHYGCTLSDLGWDTTLLPVIVMGDSVIDECKRLAEKYELIDREATY